MALVVSGLLNKQVGAEFGISEITVKAHRGRTIQEVKAALSERLRAEPSCDGGSYDEKRD